MRSVVIANFRRAVFGEGGPVRGSRALAYDATRSNDWHPDDQLGAAACIPGVLALRVDLEREL